MTKGASARSQYRPEVQVTKKAHRLRNPGQHSSYIQDLVAKVRTARGDLPPEVSLDELMDKFPETYRNFEMPPRPPRPPKKQRPPLKNRSEGAKKRHLYGQRLLRDLFLAFGLCIKCGRVPHQDGQTACDACSQKSSRSKKALFRKRKKKGICTSCGDRWAVEGHVTCQDCFDASRADQRTNDYSGKTYRQRREEGRCPRCGKVPEKCIFCNRCLRKQKLYNIRHLEASAKKDTPLQKRAS